MAAVALVFAVLAVGLFVGTTVERRTQAAEQGMAPEVHELLRLLSVLSQAQLARQTEPPGREGSAPVFGPRQP